MKQTSFPDIVSAWLGERTVHAGALALSIADSTLHLWLEGRSFPPKNKIAKYAAEFRIKDRVLAEAITRGRKRRAAQTRKEITV